MASSLPPFSPVPQAAKILESVTYQTSVLRSSFLNDRCGGPVFLPCENLQRTWACKFRWASHACSTRSHRALSSGGHAVCRKSCARARAGQSAVWRFGAFCHAGTSERGEASAGRKWGAKVTVVLFRPEGQAVAQELVW